MEQAATTTNHQPSDKRTGPSKGRQTNQPPSFTRGIFVGHILNGLLPYPKLNADEQEVLRMTGEALARLSKEVDIPTIEETKKLPPELLRKVGELGLFGAIVPEQYGGFGFSNAAYVQLMSELTGVEFSLTVTVVAHQSIGLKGLLMYGNEDQKQRFLPKLATGEMIAAFALTEPGAGSDAGSIQTTAVPSPDGKGYILNGSKIWITNGGFADFFTVFARTPHLAGKDSKKNPITAFLVTRDSRGFSSGPEEKKMGIVGSSTVGLTFDNVFVPNENVLGEPGQGFKVAVSILNNGRLGAAATCTLGLRRIINRAMEHATQRKQFGQSLSDFDLIRGKFANMILENYAAEAMIRVTAHGMDSGNYDCSLEAALCKIYCTEAEWRAANECLQIAGGTGYMREYGYEKLLRDSRILMIWEGTNEILRLFVGLSGLQGPGEQLKEVAKALREPLEDVLRSIGVLSEFSVKWLQRKIAVSDKLENIHPTFAAEALVFERYTAKLADFAQASLRKHGKDIVKNQFEVKRFADSVMELYAMACTLSRATNAIAVHGEEGAAQDIAIAKALVRKSRRRIAENYRRMHKSDDDSERLIAKAFFDKGGYPAHSRFLDE